MDLSSILSMGTKALGSVSNIAGKGEGDEGGEGGKSAVGSIFSGVLGMAGNMAMPGIGGMVSGLFDNIAGGLFGGDKEGGGLGGLFGG